jgi:tetratricopeptide (TPR) repeat protein
MGQMMSSLGQFAEARRLFNKSLVVQRELGRLFGIGWNLSNLSWLAYHEGDFAEAKAHWNALLSLQTAAKQEALTSLLGPALYNSGWAAWALGDYADASDFFQKALEFCEVQSIQERMSGVLCGLGLVALTQGKLDEDRQHLTNALQIAQDIGDPVSLAVCNREFGRLESVNGNYVQARNYLEVALAHYRSSITQAGSLSNRDINESLAISLVILSDVDRAEGDFASASRNLIEALHTAQIMHSVSYTLMVLAGIAELLSAQEQFERAVELAVLVRENPKAFAVDKERSARLLNALKDLLLPTAFNAALERGEICDLDTTVRELLATTGG